MGLGLSAVNGEGKSESIERQTKCIVGFRLFIGSINLFSNIVPWTAHFVAEVVLSPPLFVITLKH